MDADGGLPVALVGSHLIQHLKDGRDGLWHAVIRPRDIMQLFQGPATLEEGGGGEEGCTLFLTQRHFPRHQTPSL